MKTQHFYYNELLIPHFPFMSQSFFRRFSQLISWQYSDSKECYFHLKSLCNFPHELFENLYHVWADWITFSHYQNANRVVSTSQYSKMES